MRPVHGTGLISAYRADSHSKGRTEKVKTTIIALSAAALIAATPAALAQTGPGKTTGHHKVAKKHHASRSVSVPAMRARRPGYPQAFGHAPGETVGVDRETEMSRQAGGGGGGGSGM